MQNIKLKQPIFSFTGKELLDNEDPNFLHRSERVKELEPPVIEYCYANSVILKIKSSHFGETTKLKNGKTGVNRTWYKVYILFEDFYCLAKDKDIDFEDAIDYAINYGDIHIRCQCPSFLYHGFAYISDRLKYLYGIPREKRFPEIRNPNLKSTMCKHCDVVIEFLLRNKDLISKMFALYYNRLNDGQSIYAVNPMGTTVTIGKKNGEGDVFFERIQEEETEQQPEEELIEDTEEQTTEEDNLVDSDEIGSPDDWWADEEQEGEE